MSEFMLFRCLECGENTKVKLEEGDAKRWETEGTHLCDKCFENVLKKLVFLE